MHVSIIGAAGMVGRKLSEAIARDGGIDGKPVGQLTLVDVIARPHQKALPARSMQVPGIFPTPPSHVR